MPGVRLLLDMKKILLILGAGNTVSHLRLALSALVILWCPFSITAQVHVPSIDAFLKSTLKGEDRLSVDAKGDLNGDGLEDWAGVIHRQPADSSPTYQLYVLLRLRQGGYHVAEKSIEEEIPGAGCCWVESLEIRRSSIYIQNNAKTVSIMEAVTHQFKLYKGEWRLVGIRIYHTDHSPDAPATIDTDMNLLTGSVIEKRQQGDNKPVTKSRRKRFAIYLLKDFDFSTRFGNEEA
jgi:hypothetical protein